VNAAEDKSMMIGYIYIETGRKKRVRPRVSMVHKYTIYTFIQYTYYCDNDDRNIMIYCV